MSVDIVPMQNTPNVQNFNIVISRVGDITLSNIINASGKNADAELLVVQMAQTILGLTINTTNVTVKGLTDIDKQNITLFLNSVATAITSFLSFLDYDGNGQVELVSKDTNGNIVVGSDIITMEKDFEAIGSAFKNQGSVGATVLAILSSLTMYFTSQHFTTEEEKFLAFKTACQNVYTQYLPIKSIDHVHFFQDNIKDIMTFIITLCVISIPTIELANQQIASINALKTADKPVDLSTIQITNKMISDGITKMYGTNLSFIMTAIGQVVTVFTVLVAPTGCLGGLFERIGSCCSKK